MLPEFDVVVIGGGHAGCEAAHAAARMGLSTALVSMNLHKLAMASCNPAIGGLAKGHLAREVDAMGGLMGRVADATGIQFRRLNVSKGPAVRSTRAQIDQDRYARVMRAMLEATPGLVLLEDEAVQVLCQPCKGTQLGMEVAEGGCGSTGLGISGVELKAAGRVRCRSLVLCAGTFLRGVIHIGTRQFSAGRMDDASSESMTASLLKLGLTTARLKTGTPARILASSVDLSVMRTQHGDVPPPMFSWSSAHPVLPQVPCYETHTTIETHRILSENLHLSPLFSGQIQSRGPRYCPSIEDKIVRFADRESHQVFIEPVGLDSPLLYPNGLSTSLPLDVQERFLRTVPGLEKVAIAVPAYAIEYDFFPPTQLRPSLETRAVSGLFLAGQVNGTSGYEEAAAQGLLAGINAAQSVLGKEPVVLGRHEAYAGVLVDDLTTLGTSEPYRMFTSRAEYRLLLREANAPKRLTPLGRSLGIVQQEQWDDFQARAAWEERILGPLREQSIAPDDQGIRWAQEVGTPVPASKTRCIRLLERPEVTLASLATVAGFSLDGVRHDQIEELETMVKFSGYIAREENIVARLRSMENKSLPPEFPYRLVEGLTTEVVEKLEKIRPATLGQASRIPGMTPAAVANLLIVLTRGKGIRRDDEEG